MKKKVEDKIEKKIEKVGNYFLIKQPLERFTTGCELLDWSIGGGWPERRIINIIGDASSGKTLICSEAAINFLRKYENGKVYYLEAEAAFDITYAQQLGLPIDKVEFIENIDTVEGLYDKLTEISGIDEKVLDAEKGDEETIKVNTENTPTLFIVDSLDALGDMAEKEREIEKGSMGTSKARKLSELFRRLTKRIAKANITLMIISQVRDNIGVTFGCKDTTSGGRALEFYASLRLWLAEMPKKIEKTIDGDIRKIGMWVKTNCKKNKVGTAFRTCEIPIIYYFGIDDVLAHLSYLEGIKKLEEIKKELGLKGSSLLNITNGIRESKESVSLQDSLKQLVKHYYNEIESQFLPKTGKYV